MKKTLITTAALAALMAGALFAQPGHHEPEGPGEKGLFGHFPGALAEYLELTADQQDAARAIREDAHAASMPIVEGQRDLHGQLRDAVQADPADPEAIGEIVLAIEAGREQLRAIKQGAENDFEALLTSDQLDALETFKGVIAVLRPDRGGRGGQGGPGGDDRAPGGHPFLR